MTSPRLYKVNNEWRMDTTTKVGNQDIPIAITPDSRHIALWLAFKSLEQHCILTAWEQVDL